MYSSPIVQMRVNIAVYALLLVICTAWLFYYPSFAATIELCDKPMLAHDPVITIEPYNPEPGNEYTISTAFTMKGLENDIDDGNEDLKITFSGFPIENERLPLCENVPCPISNGFHNFSWNGDVPTGVHGDILISEDWSLLNGTSILCFSVGYYL
jgi:hypothetical protein